MQESNEEDFKNQFETFYINLSDGTPKDLIKDGQNKTVEYSERLDFIRLALIARITEAEQQCDALRRGIAKIVPVALLNIVNYKELEQWVCGKAEVDIDLLKRHTKYVGFLETDAVIQYFWETLQECSSEDRLKFIKFCWGQERLPALDQEYTRTSTRFQIKQRMQDSYGDGALPKADTCFFNLELPSYSSKEVLKEKLLLAIRTDNISMNAEANQIQQEQQIHDYDDY